MTRLLTAAVAVPVLLYVILWAPAVVLAAVVGLSALLAYWELGGMFGTTDQPFPAAGYVATAVLVASFYVPGLDPGTASLVAVLLLGLSCVLTARPGADAARATLAAVFATFYVGALLGSLVGLRMMTPDDDGRRWVVFLLAVVMVGDAAAFYVGKSLGRRKLAPALSPNKTVEGLLGGVAGSLGTALLLRELWFDPVSLPAAAALGVTLSLLGVCGDLFESFLKRSAGVKDASSLIPGHGGVLDRLDSILFAAPGLYLALRWLL